jgi:sulfatase maturation enzyme AslB (radical SAM superfamily)
MKKYPARKTVMLMLTYECNLDCVYCYEKTKDTNKKMPISLMQQKIIEHLSAKDSFDEIEFDFMGGEPLLEFDTIKEISEWIWSEKRERPYILFATTNGTVLNDEQKKWFTTHKHQIVLGLSYDGNPDMQNISRSRSAKQIDLNYFIETWPEQPVKMTISRQTLRTLSDGIIYLHKNGVKKISVNLAYGIEWTKDDLKNYAKQLLILAHYYSAHKNIEPCSLFQIDFKQILYPKTDRKYCGAGTGTFFIDYDGAEYPCHMFSPVVNKSYTSQSFKNIDFSDTTLFRMSLCEKCLLCNICPCCYGMNYLRTKTLYSRLPVLCEAFKIQCMAYVKMYSTILNEKQELSKEEYLTACAINKLICSTQKK